MVPPSPVHWVLPHVGWCAAWRCPLPLVPTCRQPAPALIMRGVGTGEGEGGRWGWGASAWCSGLRLGDLVVELEG